MIIPLEFDRGMAQRCIRGWSLQQTLARDQYEILVAASEDHDREELGELAGLLGSGDRVLRFPVHHDMALVAEAAKQAQGSHLVFTESHCLPEPDFLERAAEVLRDRPEWSGFSGRSVPMTHNLLSEIEAEMYQQDISRNMLRHEWLKVLDQCFVISSAGYRRSGGIEPEYGHFAEWLFAARCHRAGVVIGYDARPAIRHYYVGDLAELEAFTADFATGEMLFASRSGHDGCADLFAEVPEWQARHERNPLVPSMIVGILWEDLSGCFRKRNPAAWLECLARWPWKEAGFWLAKKLARTKPAGWRLQRRIDAVRTVVKRSLTRGDKSAAQAAFLRLMNLRVKLAREHYLDQAALAGDLPSQPDRSLSQWRAARCEKLATAGLHGLECRGRIGFRWSRPVAAVQLPECPGPVRIKIEWAVPHDKTARFYLANGRLAPIEANHVGETMTELTVLEGTAGAMLAFVCPKLSAPDDERSLGVALASVCCQRM